MKKIFTILLAAGSVTFASAQSSSHNGNFGHDVQNDSRDVILGQKSSTAYNNNTSNYGSYSFNTRERDEQIQRINREFNQRIGSVKRDRHLRSSEKTRQIRLLERQRDEQIKQVQMLFSNSKNSDWRADNRDSRKW